MTPDAQAEPVSMKMVWAGRIVSALPVLMLLFSATGKFLKPEAVVTGFGQLGWPHELALALGIVELSLHRALRDSADRRARRDLADRLPGRCHRHPCADRRAVHHAGPFWAWWSGWGFICAMRDCGHLFRCEANWHLLETK